METYVSMGRTWMSSVADSEPTVSATVWTPAAVKVCEAEAPLAVPPSPKSQVAAEASPRQCAVKATASGAMPTTRLASTKQSPVA